MKNYIEVLSETALFKGIEQQHIEKLISCVNAQIITFHKNQLIIEEGSSVTNFGIVLSGNARSFKIDTMGRIITITLLKKGSEMGVMLAASFEHKSPVSVQALEDLSALMIPYNALLARCNKNCRQHERMLRNYISIVAEKGLVLHERIDCLLKPTVRDKIMAYLFSVSKEQASNSFSLPLDRYAMSEYLNIERSALSRELSRMKRDGIIDYIKSDFKIL